MARVGTVSMKNMSGPKAVSSRMLLTPRVISLRPAQLRNMSVAVLSCMFQLEMLTFSRRMALANMLANVVAAEVSQRVTTLASRSMEPLSPIVMLSLPSLYS